MSAGVDMMVVGRWRMAKSIKNDEARKNQLRDAKGTRMRILEAAQLRFCKHGYEQVGVREIAADAGIDAALINRYFGTKEELFAEVSKGVFSADNFVNVAPDQLGDALARRLMYGTGKEKTGANPFELLLQSAVSPTASPIIAKRLHKDFVLRLAALIGGKQASARAALIASYIIGFLTVRVALHSPAIVSANAGKVVALLGGAIQAAIDDPR
jgi:AcrR family transcriptional regulator